MYCVLYTGLLVVGREAQRCSVWVLGQTASANAICFEITN